ELTAPRAGRRHFRLRIVPRHVRTFVDVSDDVRPVGGAARSPIPAHGIEPMSIIIPGGADASGFASTILRHFPDGTAPREVIDRGQTLRVLAFPFNWTAEICAAHDLRSAGTYILAGEGEAYIG